MANKKKDTTAVYMNLDKKLYTTFSDTIESTGLTKTAATELAMGYFIDLCNQGKVVSLPECMKE